MNLNIKLYKYKRIWEQAFCHFKDPSVPVKVGSIPCNGFDSFFKWGLIFDSVLEKKNVINDKPDCGGKEFIQPQTHWIIHINNIKKIFFYYCFCRDRTVFCKSVERGLVFGCRQIYSSSGEFQGRCRETYKRHSDA